MFFKQKPEQIAAVDLGSNSFHLTVARVQDGRFHVIDTLKEMVRLGSGITANHGINAPTAERALGCLNRFGQRLRGMSNESVRVTGTNALRRASQAGDFILAAEQALGYPIEIISGIEEARLIYVGVNNSTPNPEQQKLIIDIGGGSTELIIGSNHSPHLLESLYMGCVSMSMKHFTDGKVNNKRMQKAILSAQQELEPVSQAYRQLGWEAALGSSGTIRSIAETIAALGGNEEGITPKNLQKLRDIVVKAGHIEALNLPAVSVERLPVFPGGLAILIAVFDALQIKSLKVSQSALREGILYEFIGRVNQQDIHNNTIARISSRYQIDTKHAKRVTETTLKLFKDVQTVWQLDNHAERLCQWAASLHEVGLAISHSRFHQHGAYLIEHSDLHGFSKQEQAQVAMLIRMHRRKLRPELYTDFDEKKLRYLQQLAILIRLAAVLHRGRSEKSQADCTLQAKADTLLLSFPEGWLAEQPLTAADLEQEQSYLQEINFTLNFQ